MHELKAGLYLDKFVTFWLFPEWFYYSFALQRNVFLKVLSSKCSNFLFAYVARFKNTFCDVIRKRNNVIVSIIIIITKNVSNIYKVL